MSTGRHNKYLGPRRGNQTPSRKIMRRVLGFPGERTDGKPSLREAMESASVPRVEEKTEEDDSDTIQRSNQKTTHRKTRKDRSPKDCERK